MKLWRGLCFRLWLLGAADEDGFAFRAQVLRRVERGLLGAGKRR